MRVSLSIIFCTLYIFSAAQKIEYRNDSLFVNGIYVDARTSKADLDKILNEDGKIRRSVSHLITHPVTGKKAKEKTVYYFQQGLLFRWYDFDSSKLSVAVKLQFYDNSKLEVTNGILGKLFKGDLMIGDSYWNKKNGFENLNNASLDTVSTNSALKQRTWFEKNLFYKQNVIRLSFSSTKQLTTIFIHHNFPCDEGY